MMCFIPTLKASVKYAPGLPCGAMLGYVMDGDVRRAHTAICKAIKTKRAILLLHPNGEFRPLHLANSHEYNGVTMHDLPDGVFLIYHLLLAARWN
jgi:hypothetical protein